MKGDRMEAIRPPSSRESLNVELKFPRSKPVHIKTEKWIWLRSRPGFVTMILIAFLGLVAGILIGFLFPYDSLSFLFSIIPKAFGFRDA